MLLLASNVRHPARASVAGEKGDGATAAAKRGTAADGHGGDPSVRPTLLGTTAECLLNSGQTEQERRTSAAAGTAVAAQVQLAKAYAAATARPLALHAVAARAAVRASIRGLRERLEAWRFLDAVCNEYGAGKENSSGATADTDDARLHAMRVPVQLFGYLLTEEERAQPTVSQLCRLAAKVLQMRGGEDAPAARSALGALPRETPAAAATRRTTEESAGVDVDATASAAADGSVHTETRRQRSDAPRAPDAATAGSSSTGASGERLDAAVPTEHASASAAETHAGLGGSAAREGHLTLTRVPRGTDDSDGLDAHSATTALLIYNFAPTLAVSERLEAGIGGNARDASAAGEAPGDATGVSSASGSARWSGDSSRDLLRGELRLLADPRDRSAAARLRLSQRVLRKRGAARVAQKGNKHGDAGAHRHDGPADEQAVSHDEAAAAPASVVEIAVGLARARCYVSMSFCQPGEKWFEGPRADHEKKCYISVFKMDLELSPVTVMFVRIAVPAAELAAVSFDITAPRIRVLEEMYTTVLEHVRDRLHVAIAALLVCTPDGEDVIHWSASRGRRTQQCRSVRIERLAADLARVLRADSEAVLRSLGGKGGEFTVCVGCGQDEGSSN